MPNNIRGGDLLLSGAALTAGSATGASYVGSSINVVVYLISNVTTTLTLQCAMKQDGSISAGMNTDLSGATWCNYVGFDNLSITANTPVCVDLSPFSPQYVRVKNTGGSNITTGTILVETNG